MEGSAHVATYTYWERLGPVDFSSHSGEVGQTRTLEAHHTGADRFRVRALNSRSGLENSCTYVNWRAANAIKMID
jgi:hypothetical protein